MREAEERLACPRRKVWNLIQPATAGTPLNPRNLMKCYKALPRAAGLPAPRFHDRRHSCASPLIAQGIPLEIVKDTLGHSQIGLTMYIDVHLLPETQRQTADAMDRLFGAA